MSVIKTVPCPFCGTGAGQPCRDNLGRFISTIHISRETKYMDVWD
jgi:hypothetical protein